MTWLGKDKVCTVIRPRAAPMADPVRTSTMWCLWSVSLLYAHNPANTRADSPTRLITTCPLLLLMYTWNQFSISEGFEEAMRCFERHLLLSSFLALHPFMNLEYFFSHYLVLHCHLLLHFFTIQIKNRSWDIAKNCLLTMVNFLLSSRLKNVFYTWSIRIPIWSDTYKDKETCKQC